MTALIRNWIRLRRAGFHQTRKLMLLRNLSSTSPIARPDHISVTAEQTRHNIMAPATVTEIQDLSKMVKLLKLHVREGKFSFKAGQWIDMFIPGIHPIGGFSICSDPQLLRSCNTFHLAIKFATHPPANWVHTKCQVGDSVTVRAGGDFFYDPQADDTPSDILLLGGGVGVNPLYSILLHFVFLSNSDSISTKNRKATLILSAKTDADLLFRDNLMKIVEANSNVTVKLHSTADISNPIKGVLGEHIDQNHIQNALSSLDKSRTDVYICGPRLFIHDMESHCHQCGVNQDKIHYEKWW